MKILKIDGIKSNRNKQNSSILKSSVVSEHEAIRTISKSANDAIKQNAMANISFKGTTIGPVVRVTSERYNHTSANTPTGWSYDIDKGAIPTRENVTANRDSKIYIADPDEAIPEEIYKSHDFVKKTDMHLSQIRNDYRNGYQNFAQNAQIEKNHFEWLKSDAQARLDKNIAEKNHRTNILDSVEQEDSGIKERLKTRCDQEINIREKEIEKANNDLARANDKIAKSSQRFVLLTELDNFGAEKANLINKQNELKQNVLEYSRPSYYSSSYKGIIPDQKAKIKDVIGEFKDKVRELDKKKVDINKVSLYQGSLNDPDEINLLNKAKAKTAILINDLEAKFKEEKAILAEKLKNEKAILESHELSLAKLEEQLKNMNIDFANIDVKLDGVFSRVERFYKHNYSHWCR